MLAGDHQPRFGQQEMDVGDAAVQRILDRDDRAIGAAVLHRVDRVLEVEAGQRQPVGKGLAAPRHGELAPGAPWKATARSGSAAAASVIAATIGAGGRGDNFPWARAR